MKQVILTPLMLLALFTLGSAGAQEVMLFEDLDVNHNGAISMNEAGAEQALHEDFDMIDSNGDGSLSVDEYTAYHNKGQLIMEEVEVPEPGAAPVQR